MPLNKVQADAQDFMDNGPWSPTGERYLRCNHLSQAFMQSAIDGERLPSLVIDEWVTLVKERTHLSILALGPEATEGAALLQASLDHWLGSVARWRRYLAG